MNITKFFLVGVFGLLLITSCSAYVTGKQMKNGGATLTLDEAIEKGKKELKGIGYVVEDMRVIADQKNTAWQKFVATNPSILQNEVVKRMKLEEKNYWAVYYSPKKPILGGDAWVFVDASNGNIIGVLRGK